jgi:predicted ATPase
MLQRDVPGVIVLSKRLLQVSTEYETFKGSREGTIFHCWGELHSRWDAAVLNQMMACIESLDSAGNWVMLAFYLASAAEVRGDHGDLDGAAALLARAAELTRITGEHWCEAEIKRLKARFAARDADETRALLQDAIVTARAQGAKWWELRAATDLARVWNGAGKPEAALTALRPVYDWFTEGLELPDLVIAKAVLAELGGRG